jgi:very-short-patch-repair endonuclease
MIGLRHSESGETLWLTPDHLALTVRRVKALSAEGGWSDVSAVNFERAREMRREMTKAERALWSRLRGEQLGVKFRRQHPLGPYIADFYARRAGLVVEVDGDGHFETNDAREYDRRRDEFMRLRGLRVLRFGSLEVLENIEGVAGAIWGACRESVLEDDEGKQWISAERLEVGDVVYCRVDVEDGLDCRVEPDAKKPHPALPARGEEKPHMALPASGKEEAHNALPASGEGRGGVLTRCRVTSIERQHTVEDVYDLEVEGAHSFLTEVCAVHNCGSGTTAYVAEQWGRRWITIDTSRVALALARTRLMAARFPFYLLADSPEGAMKEAELTGRVPDNQPTAGDIRKGFVYKRVPHITLKAIANNEEIDAIHARRQEELEPLRAGMNGLLKQKWEEWEVPREADRAWPEKARQLHAQWWETRRRRQKEIDDSIARRADLETLYDQPYEDNKRIRVTGPFTVESLSPHRTISVEEKKSREESGFEDWKIKEIGPSQFGLVVIENLKKAGVQNTIKQERLTFDRLEPFPGTWLHAAGEFTEKDGRQRRAAVCIGPEHGTVDRDLLKEAAKEAVKGVGFDLLLVCGFAFDPHVNEEAKNYGKLVVLPTRINADLQMGDEFLKKTGAGNLFTVFGEPDIEIQKVGQVGNLSEKIIVEIKGLDIYDPTTGQIKNHTTDEIACWFIDTNYNGESFFVRHAYFTGAGDPYERLRRALKAEINEAAWQALYSTRSRPFDPPATGKIAVKVINHYGDEVLKVYERGSW